MKAPIVLFILLIVFNQISKADDNEPLEIIEQAKTTEVTIEALETPASIKFNRAQELNKKGDYINAIRLLEEAVSLSPEEFYIQYALINLYIKTSNYQKGLETSDRYIEDSNDELSKSVFLSQKGLIWESLGNSQEALIAFKKALKITNIDWVAEKVQAIKDQKNKDNRDVVTSILFSQNTNRNEIINLIKTLDEAVKKNPKRIDLYISSRGGSVSNAILAHTYIKSLPIKVRTINASIVQSSANLLFCAGSERVAVPYSSFLFHRMTRNGIGKGSTVRDIDLEVIQTMRLSEKAMKDIVENCLPNVTPEEISDYYVSGIALSAKKAKQIGFVTKILKPSFDIYDMDVVPPTTK